MTLTTAAATETVIAAHSRMSVPIRKNGTVTIWSRRLRRFWCLLA
jgi:hypothetical protein